MFTPMIKTKIIALSAALGLIFTGFIPSHKRECFLPSPATESTVIGESFGSLTVIESDEVEFSMKIFEWLRDIFKYK